MLGVVDSEPWPPPSRRTEIDARLDAIRARLEKLRERERDPYRNRPADPSERLEAALSHAADAQAAAEQVLAASAEAFRHAAEAHDRTAGMHERAAEAGFGEVREHERQAALHHAAAAADRRRADRALSLLSEFERAGPAVCDEPDGAAP